MPPIEANLLYPFTVALTIMLCLHLFSFSGSLWQPLRSQPKMIWLFFLFAGELAVLFNMLIGDMPSIMRLPLIAWFSISVYSFWLGALPTVLIAITLALLPLKHNILGILATTTIGATIAGLFCATYLSIEMTPYAIRGGAFATGSLAILTLPKPIK